MLREPIAGLRGNHSMEGQIQGRIRFPENKLKVLGGPLV